MIVGLEGLVEKKDPNFLHLNVNSVIYEIFISLNCSICIDKDKVKLYITQIIREDSNTFYGFLDINEKNMFNRLIKINGVGPKVAIAICSTFNPNDFYSIINSNDIDSLKRVPGIGAKSASRILVELSGFTLNQKEEDSIYLKADLALISLGFKKDLVSKVLKTCKSNNLEELIKEALKKIGS